MAPSAVHAIVYGVPVNNFSPPLGAVTATLIATGADWVTVNVCPAMVIVPMRCDVPVLGATEYPTDPLPRPVAPDVTVIHAAVLVAVHEHVFAEAVTATVPVLLAAATARLAGASEYVHVVPILMTKASAHG